MSLRGQSGPLMSYLGPSLPIRAFGTMSGFGPISDMDEPRRPRHCPAG
jgi:hypothetical protein